MFPCENPNKCMYIYEYVTDKLRFFSRAWWRIRLQNERVINDGIKLLCFPFSRPPMASSSFGHTSPSEHPCTQNKKPLPDDGNGAIGTRMSACLEQPRDDIPDASDDVAQSGRGKRQRSADTSEIMGIFYKRHKAEYVCFFIHRVYTENVWMAECHPKQKISKMQHEWFHDF